MKKNATSATRDLVKACCRALDGKLAADLRVLDVSGLSTITDFLVLATGNSEPHLRALRIEVEKVLDAAGAHIVGMETATESGWMVIDAFDLMVHLFTAEQRARFGLENLWKDAAGISVPGLLEVAKPKRARKQPAAKKTAAGKITARKSAPRKPAGKK